MANKIEGLTPSQIVEKLDNYIIGQNKAKRFVAVALRNRQRRIQLPEEIRDEVAPKNILMMGPTGCGKTEIARRLAKLCGAPFLKVEATKYTEVGYVGRDVESMVRDLMAVGVNMVKSEMQEKLREKCIPLVEEQLLDLLLPGSGSRKKNNDEPKKFAQVLGNIFGENSPIQGSLIKIDLPKDGGSIQPEVEEKKQEEPAEEKEKMASTREKFRQMLREGKLEDREVEVVVHKTPNFNMGMMGGSPEDIESSLNGIQEMLNGGHSKKKTVTVREARNILMEQTLDRQTDSDKVADEAKNRVEQSGII
ncbi:MAG: AAA family ATPase, partial [Treponema sp.]|nr:AAA family ATPase [Treponema sp.]